MAGYYGEPQHRDTQFDTQTLEPPVRVTPEAFSRPHVGMAGYYGEPQHRDTQFDTQTLEPPVRVTPEAFSRPHVEAGASTPDYRSSGHTPMHSSLETQANLKGDSIYNSRHMQPRSLVIANLILRAAAAVLLIVGVAILASDSATLIGSNLLTGFTFDVSTFSSTRYALAAAIIGAVYSIYETISAAVRLAMKHPLLPRNISLFISYIGDQVVVVLLLSGASAAAATLSDLHVLQAGVDGAYCDYLTNWCNQAMGGIAMLFLGFCFVAASLVISSYCFYTGRS